MNLYFSSLFCVLFFVIPMTIQAQLTTISGTVQDDKTKELLYPATIRLLGRDGGTLTDIDGSFNFVVEGNIDSFSCSYLGYKTQIIKVKKGKKNEFKIKLKSSDNKLEMATVEAKKTKMPKDTLALRLWRNIVANKTQNQALVSDFLQYKNYNKVEIDIDQFNKIAKFRPFRKTLAFMLKYVVSNEYENYLPVLLAEDISEFYIQKTPNKTKEIVTLGQVSGVPIAGIGDFIKEEVSNIDIYSNNIKVMNKSIQAPFSPTSNIMYKYFVNDSLEKEGKKFYKLEFMGKTPQEVAFGGYAWVEDSTFAIHDVNMNIPRSANINFLSNFKVEQKYERLEDNTLLKIEESGERTLSIFKPKKRDPFGLSFRSKGLNYDIKSPDSLPDSLFTNKNKEYKDNYFNQEFEDSPLMKEARPLELTENETGIQNMIAELVLNIMMKRNSFKTLYQIGRGLYTGYVPFGKVEVGNFYELLSYNAIEGLRIKLGARSKNLLKNKINLSGYGAYGTKDKLFKWSGKANWNIHKTGNLARKLSASYTYDYTLPSSFSTTKYDNIFYSIIRQNPLDRLLKISTINIAYEHQWEKSLSSKITLSNKEFYGDAYTGFEFFNEEGSMANFKVNQVHFNTYFGNSEHWYSIFLGDDNMLWKNYLPKIHFDYTFNMMMNIHGKNLLSHKFDLRLAHQFNWILGETRTNLHLSKSLGDIAYPLMTIHNSNETFLINRKSYNMMLDGEFVSDASIGILFEHYFNGFILNKIPLIRTFKFREVFFYRGLWGSAKASNLAIMNLPTGTYIPNNYQEIGFGIENIFKVIRVDFIWRLTNLEQINSKPFGMKVGIYPKI